MIISVASGKGGTGKTLVATSLALSLKDRERVQLLDCDVEEPNDHLLLKPLITSTKPVCIPVPKVDEQKCTHCGQCAKVCAFHSLVTLPDNVLVFPQLCHGCGACTYLCPEKAISEEMREIGVVESGYAHGIELTHGKLNIGEAMPGPVIRLVKDQVNKDGVVIIDVPPGTSCPVVESIRGSDFCLLVTEPTPFGLNDLALAVATVRELGIPCGIVLNRAGTGDIKVEEFSHEQSIPILLTIPLDRKIACLYSDGVTLVEGMPHWERSFVRLFERIREMANEGSRSLKR